MNLKVMSIFLVIFFLAIVSVSAANDDMVDVDDMLSSNVDDVVSVSCVDEEPLSVSVSDDGGDVVSVSCVDEEPLSVSVSDDGGDVVSVSCVDEEPLSVSVSDDGGDVVSVSCADVKPLTASANKDQVISVNVDKPKVSVPVSNGNSKLTGIYDKVYSTKKWKTIKLTSFKVKKSWSKSKRDKVIVKKWKAAKKKIKKIKKKYTKKGWHYNRCLWTWQVGKYKVSYQYSIQFTKTVYYNGYGKVLYVC